MRTLALAAATLSLIAPQIAAAAEAPCLTPKEATSVAAYAMPSIIGGATQRCAPALGKDSWIAANGQSLAQRYADRKAAVWPDAKAALVKLAGSGDAAMDALKSLPDATIQQMADTMVTAGVAEKVPVTRCGTIDRFLSLISPLPPENTAELIALTLGVMSRGDNPKIGKLAICKA